jgi:hypothetical protein
MNPTLIAALADDRRRQCPCGAVAQQLDGLCRGCHIATICRSDTETSHHASRHPAHARSGKAGLLARVASLLQMVTKGAGN